MICLHPIRRALLVAILLFTAAKIPAAHAATDQGQVAVAVARWLEQIHYSRQKLDDTMSQKLLDTYLQMMDYNRLYFTRQDVAEFRKKYGATLDDAIFRGDLTPAQDIFDRFKSRVESRMEKNKKLLQKNFTFDGDKVVEINRQKAEWPKDEADADRIWKDRIEAELLQEKLNDQKNRTPQEALTRRYNQVLRGTNEMDKESVVEIFLTALAQSYDPHSEYMGPSAKDNFDITMGLSLVGVGAVLRPDDGYARVVEVVAGGPADRDGRLKVNDRIVAVAQGNDEFEDVVDQKLDKVVQKIRGKKGTVVRLDVLAADEADPAKRKVIEITRDEVKLKDQEAKAEVLDLKQPDGSIAKIGWITLPSFYASMENRTKTRKSTTEDVAALIGRLKQEGIQGLVMDLRKDGGGSLEEAINLTGLFIPRGAVVQSKDSNGKITVAGDTNPSVAYSGPLMVVMNRMSASASEIFAAALQDYGRALIVGDERSFGKGTVQTLLDISKLLPFFSLGAGDAGSLKLTIQKFYRVRGGSTQLKGVESDIVLPSRTDNPEIGEGSLRNRLDYDEVAPVKIADSMAATPLFTEELRERSAARVKAEPEFGYITEDMTRMREKIAANTLSINEKKRRDELAEDKKRKDQRQQNRIARGPALDVQAYKLTLDDVAKPKLESVAYERRREKDFPVDADDEDDSSAEKAAAKIVEPDPVRDESLRLMGDLISLNSKNKTASIQTEAPR